MEFSWSAEQQERHTRTLDAVRRRFPETSGAPRVPYSRSDWRALGELGLLGACVPTEYGGAGLGALDTARLYEALGEGCSDTGLVFAASAHLFACAVPLSDFGSEELRKRYLPGLVDGSTIAGNAMTEADAGSDISRLSVTATRVRGGYVLNGQKTFVSNGPVADLLVTYATTDPESGHLGQTAFVVEGTADGVSRSEPFEKMGLRSCPGGGVRFTDCFVSDDQVIGRPGMGAAIFQHSMGWERACLFAGYLGLSARLVDRAVAHARERRQSGRRIGAFQAVSHRIVDMKLRLESGRLLLYRACWEMDRGGPARLPVALSKLAVSEGTVASAMDAVRVFGGRGYLADEGIEAALRDAMPSVLFSGTNEIQKELVARELGL
ncbi:acyl-CoA dehydrogenase family protein [Streptomyces sedi]|uniref:Acyl-CoA dehydrogenase n=1 Tax=Streptomyces sedi TaxID=555059 RepID=A0A5C4V437_9ACTN|nr:acyl-CoA dehydrogenase family protein [Streptomyces sedi]TNM30581.1 acyl-CoA dehydrogenase [Streptomyces sedi]